MAFSRSSRRAFTLIELLVVIAILAILAVVVVLTLNPAELLKQSRDANRVSDMATLTSALNLYVTDQSSASSFSMGNASSVYLSVSDPSATSTAGDQCQGLGMPSSSYAYHCASSSTYRNINNTGWIPVNFSQISSGSPIGNLPTDPTNQTSSNLYYTYETNGTQFAVTSFFESQKYAKSMENTGGVDPALYEQGTGLNTLLDVGRGLVGYWPLNEGSGNLVYDWSGTNTSSTWQGTATGTAGTYYTLGKTNQWAGDFDGSTNYIDVSTSSIYNFANTTFTVLAWVKSSSSGWVVAKGASSGGWGMFINGTTGVGVFLKDPSNSQFAQYSNSINVADGNWHLLGTVITTNTSVASNESALVYIDGSLSEGSSVPDATAYGTTSFDLTIGQRVGGGRFASAVGDVRIYDRALSATEIQEMYNAEK